MFFVTIGIVIRTVRFVSRAVFSTILFYSTSVNQRCDSSISALEDEKVTFFINFLNIIV